MADIKTLKELALHSAKGTAPANYSVQSVDEALMDGFKEMAGSYLQFMKNRYDIFEIMVETIDNVVPNRVIDAVGIFAEVKQVPQGTKAIFKQKAGKERAKKFLTQVGLSGVYETFRLDHVIYEIPAHAVGGAATIDFERFLDGAETMAELMEILTIGLTDSVYLEVQKCLRAAMNDVKRPAKNKYSSNTFEADKMVKLINVVRSYGTDVVIFAPPEFIAEMGADAIVPVGANYRGIYHPQDIDAIHNSGYINIFRGVPVVKMAQAYTDKTNEKTWIDPQLAYIFPTGKERVVKVVLEGQTQMHDYVNRDQSMEIEVYKKIGAGIITHHNWAIYQNYGITQTFESPYGM